MHTNHVYVFILLIIIQPLSSLLFVVADVLRERLKGNEVTYGVVRNINYTSETSPLINSLTFVGVLSLHSEKKFKTRAWVWHICFSNYV